MIYGRRAQLALEALIVLAGLLTFWISWFAVIGPVQEKAKNQAVERLEQAAFQRVAFALRLAQRLGNGTKISERIYLPVETRVEFNPTLHWFFKNTTWSSRQTGVTSAKTLQGHQTAWVENDNGLRLWWS